MNPHSKVTLQPTLYMTFGTVPSAMQTCFSNREDKAFPEWSLKRLDWMCIWLYVHVMFSACMRGILLAIVGVFEECTEYMQVCRIT